MSDEKNIGKLTVTVLSLKMSSDLEAVVEFFGADSIGLTRSCGEPLREKDRWKMSEKNATDRGVKHKKDFYVLMTFSG